jgi:hypothetical protein
MRLIGLPKRSSGLCDDCRSRRLLSGFDDRWGYDQVVAALHENSEEFKH